MTLGSYPGISLAQAYEKHNTALKELQQGIDPGAKAQEEKAKRKTAPTFADLLDMTSEILCDVKSEIYRCLSFPEYFALHNIQSICRKSSGWKQEPVMR